MRAGLLTLAILSAAAALGMTQACSTFSAADDVDAGGAPDAGAEAADASPLDPCFDQPGAAEYAGIYVLGGYETNDGAISEAPDILRAPLRCDGSLGAWTIAGTMPSTLASPAAGVIGDQLLLLDGLHTEGGDSFLDTAWLFGRPVDGTLTVSSALSSSPLIRRSNLATVKVGDELVLLGGQGESGPVDTVEAVSLQNGALVVRKGASLLEPAAGLAAGYANGHIVVVSSAVNPETGSLDDAGAIAAWESSANTRDDADLAAVSDGEHVYFIGGATMPNAVTIAQPGSPTAFVAGSALTMGITKAQAVAARGFVYLIGGSLGAGVMRAQLTAAGLSDPMMMSQLPAARVSHAAVIF